MSASSEVARLKRDIQGLVEATNGDLKPGSKSPMNASQKRALKSEIQTCIQTLDELATKLTG